MSKSETRHSRRLLRPMLAFAALAALAIVFAPTGSAKPPSSEIKLYDVCLQGGVTACTNWSTSGGSISTISGTNAQVTFNVHNEGGSNTTLGSLNLDMPTGVTLQLPVSDPLAATSTAGQLQLRNLNLAPGASHPVTFTITAPSICGTRQWSVAAKQSNDFNGSGNDYQLKQSGGLTSLITTGCHLAWLDQPASAVQSAQITDTAFTPGGHVVDVAIEDSSNTPIDLSTGTVTLSTVTGSFDDCGAGCSPTFTGLTSTFQNGVATFPNLKSAYTGTGFTMQASALGLTTSASSPPFVIQTNGVDCTGQDPCVLDTTINNSPLTISGNGGNFIYIAVSSSQLPSSVTGLGGGCASFIGTGSSFAETDGRSGDGTVDFTISISNNALKKAYGPNYGQPNVPICAGAKRLDADNQPIDCNQDTLGGFADRNLTDGLFNGTYGHAVCDADGYWWGVLGTFQDPISLGFDSSLIPLITGWGSSPNGAYRTFTVHQPGASTVAPYGWDGHFGY